MNRHQVREQLVFVLYQHLLLKKDLKVCFDDNFENADEFALKILEDLTNNINTYIGEIGQYLKDWSFDRLNYVDQGILLEAISEIKNSLNDKPVIIDEAINIAKKYSDESSYKYINAVLDNL